MRMTARGLNRATLGRQLLLRRESLDIAEAVRRAVALQAQHPASPYLALWNRLIDFDPADLDAAFAGGTVVKANQVRMTIAQAAKNTAKKLCQLKDLATTGGKPAAFGPLTPSSERREGIFLLDV